jgi:hypothetical protein
MMILYLRQGLISSTIARGAGNTVSPASGNCGGNKQTEPLLVALARKGRKAKQRDITDAFLHIGFVGAATVKSEMHCEELHRRTPP